MGCDWPIMRKLGANTSCAYVCVCFPTSVFVQDPESCTTSGRLTKNWKPYLNRILDVAVRWGLGSRDAVTVLPRLWEKPVYSPPTPMLAGCCVRLYSDKVGCLLKMALGGQN